MKRLYIPKVIQASATKLPYPEVFFRKTYIPKRQVKSILAIFIYK